MDTIKEGIGKLGFGLMRLPRLDNGEIDIEQTKTMVDMFMDAGFTYFDTAWAYAGSEDAIRQALVERYPRESFQLATKNAAWINCKTREEAMASSTPPSSRPVPGTSTSTSCTTSERTAPGCSTTSTCGPSSAT